MKNKYKKIVFGSLVLSLCLYAENVLPIATATQQPSSPSPSVQKTPKKTDGNSSNGGVANIESNIINGEANTNKNVVTSSQPSQQSNYQEPTVQAPVFMKPKSYTNENILLYKQNMDNQNVASKYYTEGSKSADPFVPNSLIQSRNQAMLAYNTKNQTQQYYNARINSSIQGQCVLSDDITLDSMSPAVIKTTCKTDDDRYIQMFLQVTPTPNSYALTTIPLSYVTSDGSLIKVDPQMSYITNQSGASSNIATYVNTQELSKNLSAFGDGLASGVVTGANAAIDQLRQSKTNQQATVVGGVYGQTAVTTSNTKAPTSQDYKDYGLIGLATGVVNGISAVAKNMTQNNYPWLYYIKGGSVINFYVTPLSLTQQQQQNIK